jgi:hypothetical protein
MPAREESRPPRALALGGIVLFATFVAATAAVLRDARGGAIAESGGAHWRVLRVIEPARPVPTGLVRPVRVEQPPRVEGSLVIEDVGRKPETELVPSLVEPPH